MRYILSLLFIFGASFAFGLEPVDVGGLQLQYSLNDHVEYRVDQRGEYSVEQFISENVNGYASGWLTHNKETLSFGYSNAVYWLRFKLSNQTDDPVSHLLEIEYPVLDDIQMFIYDEKNTLIKQKTLGDKIPFAERDIPHRNFLIPLTVSRQQTQTWLLRIETSSSVQVPMIIWPERDFFIQDQAKIMSMGMYYGIMLIMVLYNLVVYFSVRENSYLYYVFYVASMAFFLASLQGLSFQYIWPMATQWNDSAIVIMLSGVVCFASLFTRDFLELQKTHRLLYHLFGAVVVLSFVIIIATNFIPYYILIKTLIVLSFGVIVLVTYTGVFRWIEGFSAARLFTIAWSTMLMGGAVLALNKFNFIPRNFITENAVQLGSAIEVILLSFALADRLNQEKRERYEAQLQVLHREQEVQEAQAQALKIQRKANETLEEKVQERTNELEVANKKLADLSTTDALTGIRNRRYFDHVLERDFNRAHREKEQLAILMLDIDHFKKVNDDHGHQVGDEALRRVAMVLTDVIHRTTDVIARYGGEEFAIILPNTDLEGAQIVAEEIRQRVAEEKVNSVDSEFSVTVSIGVMGDEPSIKNKNADLWLREADSALYMAKAAGRNKVVISPHCQTKEK